MTDKLMIPLAIEGKEKGEIIREMRENSIVLPTDMGENSNYGTLFNAIQNHRHIMNVIPSLANAVQNPADYVREGKNHLFHYYTCLIIFFSTRLSSTFLLRRNAQRNKAG